VISPAVIISAKCRNELRSLLTLQKVSDSGHMMMRKLTVKKLLTLRPKYFDVIDGID
jgi:hypothetical protein